MGNDYADIAEDEQLRVNGFIKEMEIRGDNGKSYGKRKIIGYPIHFSDTPVADLPGQAPHLGEHTDEYLKKLGFADTDITQFRKDGVVGYPEEEPNPAKSKL